MTFKEAFELMGKDEAFRATVYAMNTLLIAKGVYAADEFENLFCEHAVNFQRSFCGTGLGAETSRAVSLSTR
jgi:hypothetical protein